VYDRDLHVICYRQFSSVGSYNVPYNVRRLISNAWAIENFQQCTDRYMYETHQQVEGRLLRSAAYKFRSAGRIKLMD